MSKLILNALKKIPVSTVVTSAKELAKNTVKEEAKYMGSKYLNDGMNYLANKVKKDVNSEISDIMTMPQQVALEFKKQSVHQNGQPFQKSFNNGYYYNQYDYFSDYYSTQSKRYNSTPQPNLAEIMHQRKVNIKNRRNSDMYINPER